MDSTRYTAVLRFGAVISTVVLLLVILAACGGGEDNATGTTGRSATTATTGTSGATTPTTGTDDATSTTDSGAGATTTTADTDESTSTTDTATEPTATAADDEPTPTEDAGSAATPSDDSDPLTDYAPLDPNVLPNFTITQELEYLGFDETGGGGTIALLIEQNDIDNYHTKIDTEFGDTIVQNTEVWRVGDTVYNSLNGVVTEMPAGQGADIFGPAQFLNQLPGIGEDMGAQKVGEEEVSGRETTHYRANAEQLLAQMAEDSEFLQGATNAEGDADVWIDNEHKIMIKAEWDITWTNVDGTDGLMKVQYLVNGIDSTDEVSPPQ